MPATAFHLPRSINHIVTAVQKTLHHLVPVSSLHVLLLPPNSFGFSHIILFPVPSRNEVHVQLRHFELAGHCGRKALSLQVFSLSLGWQSNIPFWKQGAELPLADLHGTVAPSLFLFSPHSFYLPLLLPFSLWLLYILLPSFNLLSILSSPQK